MRSFFIFILLHVSLFAQLSLDIATVSSAQNTAPYLQCTQDVNHTFSRAAILHSTSLHQLEKSNIGYTRVPHWCRLHLVNGGDMIKAAVLFNPRPGVDKIDVTLVYDDRNMSLVLGDMVAPVDRAYPSVFSNLSIILNPGEAVTLISRNYSIGTLELGWVIQDVRHFMANENLNFVLIASFFGFLVAMMLYKFFIYLHIGERIYLVYALMLLSIVISEASLQGTLYYFFYGVIDTFSITVSSWIFTHVFLVLLWVFTYLFFSIKPKSSTDYLLKTVIVYNIIVTLIYTFSYLDDRILLITPIIVLIALVEALGLFIFAGVMLLKRQAGSAYFFIGHLFYIAAIVAYILLISGYQEFSIFLRHSNALGLLLVISLMSLALSARFRAIKDENKRQKDELAIHQRFRLIGTTITYVFHQWKQPLAILSAQLMNLQALIDHKPDSAIEHIKENINAMHKSIIFLNDTLINIRNLFASGNIPIQNIELRGLFSDVCESFSQMVQEHRLEFNTFIDKELTVEGNHNLLFNALHNIIQNSIEQAQNAKITNLKITIQATLENESIVIILQDNAGGIKEKPIESVFDPGFSSKDSGSGIGLSIVKNIIEAQFEGKIEISNSADGARFKLLLHVKDKRV